MSERQVFRTAGAVVAWWAWLVFALASLGYLAAGGRDRSSAVTAVALIAITGVAWACALRPRIVADENGISVRNPIREHAAPWATVTKVDLVNTVRVHCAPAPGTPRGTVIHSWAVQSSGRARLRSESRVRRAARRSARQHAAMPASYGNLPPQAREAIEQSAAEFIARQLDERATRERPKAASEGSLGQGSRVRVNWSWAPIAAMVLPLLALIIAVLA